MLVPGDTAPAILKCPFLFINPLPSTVPINCAVPPLATVAVVGDIVTLVISGAIVVNKIALLKGDTENVFHT